MAKENVICTEKVHEVIKAFNNCDTYDEQLEVTNLICDVMWKTTYRALMEKYVESGLNQKIKSLSQELKDANIKIGELTSERDELKFKLSNEHKRVTEIAERLTRKGATKGLLVIINNIKHYLGDKWNTIFPGDNIKYVDDYLACVDANRQILGTDTWTQYEEKVQ